MEQVPVGLEEVQVQEQEEVLAEDQAEEQEEVLAEALAEEQEAAQVKVPVKAPEEDPVEDPVEEEGQEWVPAGTAYVLHVVHKYRINWEPRAHP